MHADRSGAATADRRDRRRGAVPAVVAVVAMAVAVWVVLVLTVLADDDEPEPAPVADDEDSEVSGQPFDPLLDDDLVVGDTARLVDGAVARVNHVEPDVTLDPGLPAVDPGTRLIRLDVELCAGTTGLFVDAAFWLGQGDDRRVHSAHLGVRDLVTIVLARGGCQRGTVDLALPEDVGLDAVVLADGDRTAAAIWAVGDASATGTPGSDPAPLTSDVAPDTAAVAETVRPDAGGTLTLHEVGVPTDDAEPPPAGAELVRVERERCAGDEPVLLGPADWLLQLADHRIVRPVRDAEPGGEGELDPGECERGTVDFHVPAGGDVAAVLYAFAGGYEEARWPVEP